MNTCTHKVYHRGFACALAPYAMIISGLLFWHGRALGEEVKERTDTTRLDVERLPPEAIRVDRSMYAHGWALEGAVGGRGFVTGLSTLSDPGVFTQINLLYEVFDWLLFKMGGEFSLQTTNSPAPPSKTVFGLVGAVIGLRLQLNLSARSALWLGPELGALIAVGDVLSAYDVDKADRVGPMVGGELGFDWHLFDRHHAIGIAAGSRLYPSLNLPDGEKTVGLHVLAYLRHVF